jgi:hypothetical protein
MPRPASTYEPQQLLEVVQVVAEAAGLPTATVSTRCWDAARHVVGQRGAPAARRICEHLDLPWTKVVELAFLDGQAQAVALGHALGDGHGDWLTDEHCLFALRLVASRLGVQQLSRGQYRSERASVLAQQGRGIAGLHLPAEHQVVALFGSWETAASRAGLTHGYGGRRAQAADIGDVLDRCFEAHGTEPTSREMEVFARSNGIVYPRLAKPWRECVADWKVRRRTQGLPVPAGPPSTAKRPDYSVRLSSADGADRHRAHDWRDRDEVIGWVVRFLQELPPREAATQRRYADWVRSHRDAPWPSSLGQHGGWAAVRDAARNAL